MASDRYSGTARCPHCDDVHWFDREFLFFNLHEWPANLFVKGVAVPVYLPRGDLASNALHAGLGSLDRHHAYVRIRLPVDDERCNVLDVEAARTCDCGAKLIPLLVFGITYNVETPGPVDARTSRATLLDIELCVSEPAVWERVDYMRVAACESFVDRGFVDLTTFEALLQGTVAERVAIASDGAELMFRVGGEDVARFRHVAGPTRCAACDQVRERRFAMEVEYTFLPERWPGTSLFLGARMDVDRRFLDEDVDDANHLRVHQPVGASTLNILGLPRSSGCACGAGKGALVLRFQRHPHGLELVDLELRVVRGAGDLDDIDFVATRTGGRARHGSRMAALEEALHQFERH